MAVNAKHPSYVEFEPDWQQQRDCYRGERAVKERRFLHLPATSGMVDDGITKNTQKGAIDYAGYQKRARFPSLMRDAVESMLGVMHNKPPKIELPAAMEPLLERATLRNESVEALLRRINEEQLVTGRLGLMLEVPEASGLVLPFIALYQAEDIINWDAGQREDPELQSLNLVVLDESAQERLPSFEWKEVDQFRVLVLGDVLANEPAGVYRAGVFKETKQFTEEELVEPVLRGRRLEEIPFVFVNAKDVVPEPDEGPLLDLSNLALTIYRTEADYRQALFMQGQDTLVTIGATADGKPVRVGVGAKIELPMGGDAKFIGVDSKGLEELRAALENDYQHGTQRAEGLIEAVGRAAESGEALKVRVAARTASLNQVAMTGAFALQSVLRMAARWIGTNPAEVVVEPNLDFVSDILKGQELVQLMTAKTLGAPIALQTIHEIEQQRGLTDLTWEEELERLQAEAELALPGAQGQGDQDDRGTEGDGPVDDEDDEETQEAA